MQKLENILKWAHKEALDELHAAGVYNLDSVKVHFAPFSQDSYCLGYDPADPVEIYVNGMRLAEAWWSEESREEMVEFIVHELAHGFLFKLWNSAAMTKKERSAFVRLFGDYDSDGEDGYKHRIPDLLRGLLGMKPRGFDESEYVSLYAATSPHEDWAETFAYYVMDGLPATGNPKKTDFIIKMIEKYGSIR